ncbi:RHOMBOID-like protein, partial [Psidium guajava]
DFVHLLSTNLNLALFCLGLEHRFGFVRFGTIYLLSGVGASILSLLFVQEGMAFGASGAIFGVLGAKLSEFITNWTLHANKGARLSILMCSSALGLGFVVLCSYMDNFGHVGGLLTGFLLGFVLLVRPRHEWASRQDRSDDAYADEPKYKMYQHALCLLGLVLLITGFTVGLVMLYKGKTTVVITEQTGFRRG